ncbi:hypothetical protein EJ06DRAFT_524087 [Trichodelitschia bisporula]|uniref:Uncharacterized protein n=1 Tax=Trichodelitschia bisporula TaxID=703511 RepID=A0A6G1HM51_9PEZI|nr:hypothetical protein EJ06DRAFT_524087 [Trichodelitschia bisporula]
MTPAAAPSVKTPTKLRRPPPRVEKAAFPSFIKPNENRAKMMFNNANAKDMSLAEANAITFDEINAVADEEHPREKARRQLKGHNYRTPEQAAKPERKVAADRTMSKVSLQIRGSLYPEEVIRIQRKEIEATDEATDEAKAELFAPQHLPPSTSANLNDINPEDILPRIPEVFFGVVIDEVVSEMKSGSGTSRSLERNVPLSAAAIGKQMIQLPSRLQLLNRCHSSAVEAVPREFLHGREWRFLVKAGAYQQTERIQLIGRSSGIHGEFREKTSSSHKRRLEADHTCKDDLSRFMVVWSRMLQQMAMMFQGFGPGPSNLRSMSASTVVRLIASQDVGDMVRELVIRHHIIASYPSRVRRRSPRTGRADG